MEQQQDALFTLSEIAQRIGCHHNEVATIAVEHGEFPKVAGRAKVLNSKQLKRIEPHLERFRKNRQLVRAI